MPTVQEVITSSLGSIYTDKTFDNYDGAEIKFKVKEHIDDKKWMYIHGSNRTGKTHLLSAIYQYYLSKNIHGVRVKKCILLDKIFSSYGDEAREDKIDDICHASILLLDDIGVGKLTPERHSQYYYIIDYRISNDLKTIFTSNYLTKDLWCGDADTVPARIISRIQEASIGIEVKK